MSHQPDSKSFQERLAEVIGLECAKETHQEDIVATQEYLFSKEGRKFVELIVNFAAIWNPDQLGFSNGVTMRRAVRASVLAQMAHLMWPVVQDDKVGLLATHFEALLRMIETKKTINLGFLSDPITLWVNYQDALWQRLPRPNTVVTSEADTSLLEVCGQGEGKVIYRRLTFPMPIDGDVLMEEMLRQSCRTLDLAEAGVYQKERPYPQVTGRTILPMDFQGCDDVFFIMTFAELKDEGELVFDECAVDNLWPAGTEFILVESEGREIFPQSQHP